MSVITLHCQGICEYAVTRDVRTVIVHVGPAVDAPGGIATVIATLCDSRLSEHYDVRAIATSGMGIGLRGRAREVVGLLRAIWAITTLSSVVHVHMASGGSFLRKSIVLLWARLLRRPTVLHLHGGKFHMFAVKNVVVRRLVRFTFRTASAVLVLSPEWALRVAEFADRVDAVVVPNPVRIPDKATTGDAGLLFLGKIGTQKGTWVLIDALEHLQRQGLRIHAIIAGDGDIDLARNRVAMLPFPEDIDVPGWVSTAAVRVALARYSLFALPSFDEGKPVALLEAMSYGLGCVATPVGGIPDVIHDGKNGLLVPPGNVEALAEAIARLHRDDVLRLRLGAAARALASKEYSIDEVVRQLEMVYTSLGCPPQLETPRDSGAASASQIVGGIHGLRAVYETSPAPVRKLVGGFAVHLPRSVRYGREFVEAREGIGQIEWATRARQDEAAERALADVVASARLSPYWSGVFADSGMPDGPHGYDELQRLPFLDKELVRVNGAEMVSPRVPESHRKWVTTGGTTGAPLGLWIDKKASLMDWAFVTCAWARVGFRLDEKRLVLRGRRLGDGAKRELVEYEPIRRELYVSTFDLDTEHLPAIREEMNRFAARFIHGYPSAMEVVGRFYREIGQVPPVTEALLAVSENLYPGQREVLEDLFDSRVFSFYGMSEKGAMAAECECSTDLHVEPLYGMVELIDSQGQRIDSPGVRGEIVVTGLLSESMPLLRYRTGDFSSWAEGPCACGRAHRRLVRVDGRWTQEYLVGVTGAKISMTALNVHSPVFDSVRRFQFVQQEPGIAILKVEPGATYTEADGERILAELDSKLSGQISLRLVEVEKVAQTALGKQRFIDQGI